MPKLQIRKTQTGQTYLVTIPKEYIAMMQWEQGDTLLFSVLDKTSLKLEKV
ncbi:MAG: AbrB/MazE/SpoVT family DNA-binding domain-containing protein [Candidatus Hermodarchaeota archaeon]